MAAVDGLEDVWAGGAVADGPVPAMNPEARLPLRNCVPRLSPLQGLVVGTVETDLGATGRAVGKGRAAGGFDPVEQAAATARTAEAPSARIARRGMGVT
ncbi:hypothetical protein I6A62_33590 [Frankia sp. AgW1.1]|nr:hypothetical protein [Frankia sp. AgW1.1]